MIQGPVGPRQRPLERATATPRVAAAEAPSKPTLVAPPARALAPARSKLAWLPSPLRTAAVMGLIGFGKAADWVKARLGREDVAAPVPSDAVGRAKLAWQDVERRYGVPGLPGVFPEASHGLLPATVWPQGQAIAAALDLAEVTGDWRPAQDTIRALDAYEHHGAYAPGTWTWGAKRLWDDNAWIGLDFMQAYSQSGDREFLQRAEALFPFMREGLHPDGGVYWEERNARMTRNTCANAPAMALALKLYQATGKPEYKAFADNCHAFLLQHMRGADGLYADNLGDDGQRDGTVWSYNQGAAIGAEVLDYQVSRDPASLARAKQTADSALRWLGQDDRLWKQAPSFNAIFFRNLLALDAVAPDPRYRQALTAYVDRVWREGRDPATGALDRGGIGHYDPAGVLDQSGFAQLTALLAWKPERLNLVA